MVAPPQTTFSWQTPGVYSTAPVKGSVFSKVEIRDIVLAWLGIGFAVGIASVGGVFGLTAGGVGRATLGDVLTFMAIALVTVGPGFVLHELSHKFVARRYGFWAEFRMWPQMLLFAIVLSLSGFLIAAPGATYISGSGISKSENGWISLAGPLTNIAVAAVFLFALAQNGIWGYVGGVGVWINIWLATFNMIPIGPLDGSKVLRWNKVLWGVSFAALAVAAYYAFNLIFV